MTTDFFFFKRCLLLLHDEEYHQNKHMSLEEENFTEHNILALPHHNSNIIPNVTQDAEKQCLFVKCQYTLAKLPTWHTTATTQLG